MWVLLLACGAGLPPPPSDDTDVPRVTDCGGGVSWEGFGQGFMRLALETETPIVPVALVGSEEQQPGIANLTRLGGLLGMPAFPITLGFPWLGPLGLLPLPVKYRFYFGEPLHFEGDHADDDASVEDVAVDAGPVGPLHV